MMKYLVPSLLFSIPLCFSLAAKDTNDSDLALERVPGDAIMLDWTKPIPVPSPLTVSVSVKGGEPAQGPNGDRTSFVSGTRVDLGGPRLINKHHVNAEVG